MEHGRGLGGAVSRPVRISASPRQRSCTDPETWTTTCVLPASTGIPESRAPIMVTEDFMAIACMRGAGAISSPLTDTSRSE